LWTLKEAHLHVGDIFSVDSVFAQLQLGPIAASGLTHAHLCMKAQLDDSTSAQLDQEVKYDFSTGTW
jgi:hypothetical protein